MKCPNDQSEMEQGQLATALLEWSFQWLPLQIKGGFFSMKNPKKKIYTYRCPQCGKIELYTEPDKKEQK